MLVRLATPFTPPFAEEMLTERKTIAAILLENGDLEWARGNMVVLLNGVRIPQAWWPHVTVKPEGKGILDFLVVPQKGNILPLLATVAVVALAAGVSGGLLGPTGLGLLGSSFLPGAIGSAAAGTAIGISGQLAISMLTAPSSSAGQAAQRDLSQAGIAQNIAAPLENLPVVFGTMLVSPPQIIPAYTTLDGDEVTVHAIVGVQGRCQIANVLVNGTDITLLDGISYETREGGPADAALTLAQLTCIQQTEQVTLSNFRTQLETNKNDQLLDQTTPANSEPDYHYFTTDGTPDEIWLRFFFPNGIIRSSDGTQAAVAARIEIRKLGDATWRKLPTCHFSDLRLGNGPMRAEVKLKFQTMPSGRHFSNASGEYPIFELTNITGIGQTFEYQSDAYFQNAAWDNSGGILPTMTAATTNGVTFSASSEFSATYAAWKAADTGSITWWRPAASSLPAWLKIDLGSATIVRCYYFVADSTQTTGSADYAPTEWYVEGSNDNSTWTRLDDANINVSAYVTAVGYFQIGNPGSYRYYRFTFVANNGAALSDLRIQHVALYLDDAPGTAIGADTSAFYGAVCLHSSNSDPRCIHGSLDKNGATFYLDPAQWLPGTYEVRIKRGVAFHYADFTPQSYSYSGVTASDFFDYRLSGGFYVTRVGQKNYRSDCNMEVFSTVSNDVPVDTTGIACIAVEMKNTTINSISAEFTSYAPVYSGGVWTDAEAVTANPAALYRQLLLGHANPDPTPGEIIDETALATWYDRCVTRGYDVNAVVQGRSIDEVKRMIAYCGYASPRDTNMVSIAEDYDRSAESIVQMISPLNARNLGNTISLPKMPHAIYAEYFDAADDWKVRRDIIYRRGFDANSATYFDSITYDGFTSTTKVAARAAFDLLQMEMRNSEHRYEMGIEGYSITRGMLVGLNDDTLDTKMGYGLIRSISTSGANVTAIEIDNIYAFSANQDDLMALVEDLDLSNATGVGIRIDDGTVLIKTATTTTDGKTVTFTTPFDLVASGIAVGHLVVLGVAGKSHKRMIVHAVVPTGLETRTIVLRDEAPELFT